MGEQVTGVGIVGTGVISGTYLDHLAKLPGVDVVAVADLDVSRAQAIADKNPGIRALSRRSCTPRTTSTSCST